MKLSEFKPVAPACVTEASPSSPSESESASDLAPQEPQYFTSVTPSGIEVAYSPAPRRHYKVDGIEVPSVTTVLGVLDKSGPLTWWGQGVGVEGVMELLGRGEVGVMKHETKIQVLCGQVKPNLIAPLEAKQIVDLLTEHKLSVNHVKDKAADRGVNVHGALEQWCDGVDPDPGDYAEHERNYISGLAEFLDVIRFGFYNVETELMVGSLEHSYAGRFDLVLTLGKPVEVVTRIYPKRKSRIEEIPAGRYLLDLKTSKGIYPTHYLQLEAYEAAAVECGYEPTDHRGVIHVTADGRYELALNKDWTFDDFLAVRKCYQVMNERGVVQALRDELDAKEVA